MTQAMETKFMDVKLGPAAGWPGGYSGGSGAITTTTEPRGLALLDASVQGLSLQIAALVDRLTPVLRPPSAGNLMEEPTEVPQSDNQLREIEARVTNLGRVLANLLERLDL